MTTLAANAARAVSTGGNRNHLPVIAADIIYEGAAVGVVEASGHARPLQSADRFAGFSTSKCDNSAGAAAEKNVEVYSKGTVTLSVTGAVITDIGQPVYAADDNAFQFNPVGGVFVGYVRRWDSAGVVEVEFNVEWEDPYGDGPKETISTNKTLDAQDTGKTFFVDTDALTVTLPATATALDCTIVNIGAFGGVAVNVSPAAADKIMGPDIAGTDNKDLINTKATAQRGDLVSLYSGHADGYTVRELVGTWAEEA